jgi:peptide subunit release factor 1 (eRF1)
MTIDRDQVKAVTDYRNTTNPVVSVYLNVTPPRQVSTELNSMIHTTFQSIKQNGSCTQKQADDLKTVMEKIQDHVQTAYKRASGTRTVAIFADADGLWEEFQLPVGLPGGIAVQTRPHIRPLTVLLDEFDRYMVIVLDSRKARVFSLYMGEFEEFSDVFVEDNVPDGVRVKKSTTSWTGGAQAGLGDMHIERHIEDHVHRHLKNIAERSFDFFKKRGFDRLILGGPQDKTLPEFKDHLHSYMKERLVAEFHTSPDNHLPDLKEKAMEAARGWERRKVEQLVSEISERSGPGEKGRLGVEQVIEALNRAQVQALVIRQEFEAEGYVCPEDNILSSTQIDCPVCRETLTRTEHLADEMVEAALDQSAEIVHASSENEILDEHGVAAKLRFTL